MLGIWSMKQNTNYLNKMKVLLWQTITCKESGVKKLYRITFIKESGGVVVAWKLTSV